ncbi:MAG: hypothetical protein V1862_04825 [Methanobacteriota archaeon]
MINGIGPILIYRQYLSLASESMEFVAMVVESIEELKGGNIQVDPLAGFYSAVISPNYKLRF